MSLTELTGFEKGRLLTYQWSPNSEFQTGTAALPIRNTEFQGLKAI